MGIAEFLPVIGSTVQKLLDLIPDPGARARAAEEYQRAMLDLAARAEAEQREINKVEAASSSLFVAGWRPAIGWVGGLALATYYLPMHVMAAVLWLRKAWGAELLPPYPIGLDDTLTGLVAALLGMGGLRTVEKLGARGLDALERIKAPK